MLAFDVSVYRLPVADSPDSMNKRLIDGDYDDLVTQWTVRAAPGCLSWIEDLVKEDKAEKLEDSGYPNLYRGETKAILDALESEINIDPELASRLSECSNDESLVVTAWDLS